MRNLFITEGERATTLGRWETLPNQLQRYRERFSQANELGLADVAEALRPLLEQTQEHVRGLQGATGR